MFKDQIVWSGLNTEEMTEVYAMIGPSLGKSPVAAPDPNHQLMNAASEIGKGIGEAIVSTNMKSLVRQAAQNPEECEYTGTISAPLRERGFGFVTPDNDEGDLFFHVRDNPNAEGLRHGTRVSYDLKRDIRSGRTSAVNVRPV